EVLAREHGQIVVLAGATGTDEAVLRAFVAIDLRVFERSPVRLLRAEAADIFLHDLFDRHIDQLGRTRMTGNAHGSLPITPEKVLVQFITLSHSRNDRQPAFPQRAAKWVSAR